MIRFLGIIALMFLPPSLMAGESWRMQSGNGHLIRIQAHLAGPGHTEPERPADQLRYAEHGAAIGAGVAEAARSFGRFELSDRGSICVRTRPGPGGCILNFTRDELFLVDRRSGRNFPVRVRFSLKP